jgi:hypothetical protein
VFEENVGIAGSTRGVFEGVTVYASRIDPLNASWRRGAPTFYRIKTYNEQGARKTVNADDLNYIYQYGALRRTRGAGEGEDVYLGKTAAFVIDDHLKSSEGKNRQASIDTAYAQAGRVPELERLLAEKPKEVIVEKIVEKIVEVPLTVYVDKPVEIIKEVIVGDDDRSIGELVSAIYKKLFKIK